MPSRTTRGVPGFTTANRRFSEAPRPVADIIPPVMDKNAHHQMLISRLTARASSVLAAEATYKLDEKRYKERYLALLKSMNEYIIAREALDAFETKHPELLDAA